MPEGPVSVLLVSGDAGLRQTIRTALNPTGFVFEEAGSAVEAVAGVLRGPCHLVLIGANERGFVGLELCSRLRAISPDLGIVLIRPGGTLQDEIHALEAGADDCLSMPFRFREIVGRLRAVLSRPKLVMAAGGIILRGGDVKVDIAQRICWRAGNQIHLSPREFDLLAALMKHQERVLTHVKLLVAVWGPEVLHDAVYLRSYVKAIREKIETDPHHPEYILTVPWVGYMFSDPRRRLRARASPL